uniref:Tim10-like domain-containing protein n=3 Tax=Setaria TaxID=4554 RepID=K4AFD4_SETIT
MSRSCTSSFQSIARSSRRSLLCSRFSRAVSSPPPPPPPSAEAEADKLTDTGSGDDDAIAAFLLTVSFRRPLRAKGQNPRVRRGRAEARLLVGGRYIGSRRRRLNPGLCSSSPRGAAMAAKGGPTNLEKEQMFGMAEKEMEYRVDLFNRLTQTCFDKCVEKRYKEAELNMGENSCIDRCVSKYWQVTNLVGQMLGNRPQI